MLAAFRQVDTFFTEPRLKQSEPLPYATGDDSPFLRFLPYPGMTRDPLYRSDSSRRPGDSLSKSRRTVTRGHLGTIHFFWFWIAKSLRKRGLAKPIRRARLWQCKCLNRGCYEKQTHTSRPQSFIHSHRNSPLRQYNNFFSILPRVLGATTKYSVAPDPATVAGSVGAGTGRATVEPKPVR